MTTQTKSNLRRIFSFSVFSALVAAVTMAFAEAPQVRTKLHIGKAEPALSYAPTEAVRLAEAPARKRAVAARPKATAKAKAAKKSSSITLTGTLNINTASALDLVKLPGIGPKKAATIVHWREKHGRFGRVVDLRRVKGFGAKSVKKLAPYLSVKGEHTLQ